ncbi:spore germination protein [Halobacillus salinus]|uniref:spore germination protein n=1 Tax=Halobacillus salinus TaxID=192814 RepID=UPI0009A88815|nr:spore germination protein [Halobacillus salinus]
MERVDVDNIKIWLQDELKYLSDVVNKKLSTHDGMEYLFLNSLTDGDKIYEYLIRPAGKMNTAELYDHILSLPTSDHHKSKEDTLNAIMGGAMVVFFGKEIVTIKVVQYESSGVAPASTEATVHGPHDALSESLQINLNLLRHRYHKPSLASEELKLDLDTSPKLVVMYDKEQVDHTKLASLKNTLLTIDGESLQSVGALAKKLNNKKNLFPTVLITERPDRISYNLTKGKIAVLLEGSPFCMILPTVFFDFMSSMDDLYQTFWVGKFLLTLRYLGLFISTTTPAFYVAATAYNPGFFQVQLALSIAGSRASVPYSSYFEILFMLLFVEFLVEASIRLPKMISPAATTVGGLILGQAATEAGLVSNIMIIIIAAVAITSFVVPINEMAFALRITKYVLVSLAVIGGMTGIIIGIAILLVYIIRLDSFNEPFVKI